MPIPQLRLIRILEAAEEYSRLCNSQWARISEIGLRALSDEIPAKDAIQQMLLIARRPERAAYLDRSIHDERARVTLTHKKNTYERERLRAKRAGVPFKIWIAHQETMLEVGEPAPPGSDYEERQITRMAKKAADIVEQLDSFEILPPHDSLGPDDSDIDFDRIDEAEIGRRAAQAKSEAHERLKAANLCKEGDLISCRWPTCTCGE